MKGIDFSSLFNLYQKFNYPFYDSGRFNVNFGAFRDDSETTDQFNDIIFLTFIDDFGRPNVLTIKGTTKPGEHWLGDKMGNAKGTFVLSEGYYRNCFKEGLHRGKYQCLIQSKMGIFKGYRDNNKNGIIDYSGVLHDDVRGLNFHTTSFLNNKDKVGAYSAGCQVAQDDKDFLMMLPVILKSMEIYGGTVSFALFNKKDFF